MKIFYGSITPLILFLLIFNISFISTAHSQGCDENGNLLPGNGEDLEITTSCMVGAGTYNYGYVNIYNGGELIFDDAVIDFWAESILIEKDSALIAENIGVNGLLTIHLYGSDEGESGSVRASTGSRRHGSLGRAQTGAVTSYTQTGRSAN